MDNAVITGFGAVLQGIQSIDVVVALPGLQGAERGKKMNDSSRWKLNFHHSHQSSFSRTQGTERDMYAFVCMLQ